MQKKEIAVMNWIHRKYSSSWTSQLSWWQTHSAYSFFPESEACQQHYIHSSPSEKCLPYAGPTDTSGINSRPCDWSTACQSTTRHFVDGCLQLSRQQGRKNFSPVSKELAFLNHREAWSSYKWQSTQFKYRHPYMYFGRAVNISHPNLFLTTSCNPIKRVGEAPQLSPCDGRALRTAAESGGCPDCTSFCWPLECELADASPPEISSQNRCGF